MTKFDAMPTQTVTFSRRNVFKRDKMTCQYCGKQLGSEELTIDHVVPRAQGGQSTWANCVLACIEGTCLVSRSMLVRIQSSALATELPVWITSTNNESI